MMHDNRQLFEIRHEVWFELVLQRERWGPQNHPPSVWMMILGEEVGEAQKAALEAWAANADLAKNLHLKELRAELIQVAAVAMSVVSSLDRNELK